VNNPLELIVPLLTDQFKEVLLLPWTVALHCEVASGVIEAGLQLTVIDAPDGTAGDCVLPVPPPQAVNHIEFKQIRNAKRK
jgi:hypothetical protein